MIEIRTARTKPQAYASEHSLLEAVVGNRRISLDHFGNIGRPLQVFTDGEQSKYYFPNELVAALQDFSDRVSKAQQEEEERKLYSEPEQLCVIQADNGNLWQEERHGSSGTGSWRLLEEAEYATVYPTVASALKAVPKTFPPAPRVVRLEDLPHADEQEPHVIWHSGDSVHPHFNFFLRALSPSSRDGRTWEWGMSNTLEGATVFPTRSAARAGLWLRGPNQLMPSQCKGVAITLAEAQAKLPQPQYHLVLQRRNGEEELVVWGGHGRDAQSSFVGTKEEAMAKRDEMARLCNPDAQYFIRPVSD